MLPHTAGTGWQRIRIGLDAAIGAISVGALAWVFVIDPIVIGLEGAPLAARIFGVLYPLVDVGALIAIVIVTIRRSSLQFDFRMLLLGGALVFQTIGDVSLLVSGTRASLEEAEPIFVAYLAASAFFLLTAMNADRMPAPRAHADRIAPAWAMVVPYAAATIMVLGLMHRLWDGGVDTDDRILLVSTVLVVVLVISRQALSIRENRVLVEQQRSDLVSSISHELRTPLTSMVGFVSVLQDGQDLSRSERSEMIGVVADQAEYLARIVEDLLTFTQGGTDAVDLDVTEQRIPPLIENAILATSIDRNHVDVEVNPTLTALVDGSRIQQILVNLLSNADRYGGDRCLIVASAVGSGLTIEVHDSGPGVPKKHEVVIWERFERGANRYNAGTPGSGIGLAMVKSLAEAHGGRASYRRSKRLGGACFVVELPGRVGKQQPIAIVPSSKRAIG
jgi:signal transduction histidine kinase